MRIGLIQAFDESREIERAYPPLGLAYLVSYARENFPEPDSLKFFIEEDIETLIEGKPDLVGVSSVTQNFNKAVKIGETIKSHLNVPTVIGGVHITALPHTLPNFFDVGVIGEGEQTFLDIITIYEKSGRLSPEELSKISGVVYHKNGRIDITSERTVIEPLDKIPFPARELFKEGQSYYNADNVYMFTSRGCPYRCVFCASTQHWNKLRLFSAKYVVSEIEGLVKRYNPSAINLYDDLFVANKKRLKEIVNLIKHKEINEKVQFHCNVRANLITQEICDLMKEMNIKTVSFGAESGAEKVLKYLKDSRVSVGQNQRALDLLYQNNIDVYCSFIIGTPMETIEDIFESYYFINKNKKKMKGADIYALIPFPGTRIWHFAKGKGLVNEQMDWSTLDVEFRYFNIDNYPLLNNHLSKHNFKKFFVYFQQLHEEIRDYHEQSAKLKRREAKITELNREIAKLKDETNNLREPKTAFLNKFTKLKTLLKGQSFFIGRKS